MSVLEVSGLSVGRGGAARPILDGVSFSIASGETLALVGESGCGKSLTALAVMGLLPTPPLRRLGGMMRLEGRDLAREAPMLRGDRMAMVFQEPMTSLNPALRVGEQIAEGLRRHRGLGAAEARGRAVEALRRVGIPSPERRARQHPHELSGGQRQRAMIAMAMACEPRLIVADEPTTALDVTIQAQILGLLREVQAEGGASLLLITHDLGVVAEMADRVAVMYAGRIVEEGAATAVLGDPQHPYTLGLVAAMPSVGPRAGRLASIPGTVPPPEAMPEGCRFAPRCPFAGPDCAEAPPLAALAPGHRAACWRAPLEAAPAPAAAAVPA